MRTAKEAALDLLLDDTRGRAKLTKAERKLLVEVGGGAKRIANTLTDYALDRDYQEEENRRLAWRASRTGNIRSA